MKNTPASDARKIAEEILGYLNFSSGTPDPGFLRNVNELFGRIDAGPAWQTLGSVLRDALNELRGGGAFRRVNQAEAVLGLVFGGALPEYRRWHRDLLLHQTDQRLFQPFFIGRTCEAVLQQGGPWDETGRIVEGALNRLNDFLGHRPVAVLETEQKIEPYSHEWVAPIPLYIRRAGVSVGPYRELIEKALEILEATDPVLLFDAWFDLELLDELALDPRAYDFDHPVNKRPNYLFGQWDMHKLDNSGRCRRFVLQQVSLDAMLHRLKHRGLPLEGNGTRPPNGLPYEEVLLEEAAVLAGTMLMGSGVSGNRPDTHDSDTTLATLVQHIAAYRDAFYEQLLAKLSGKHAKRLRAEAAALHQPLGGARQDFNQHLARRRAEQLQHVHLAEVFARMGYTEAAARQVRVVPVASARMRSDIQCRLAAARLDLDRGRLEKAAAVLGEIEDLLHRGIECGALVDPWNILGFGAQYSLFPAVENSIHDHRTDELIELVGGTLALYVQIQKQAAAAGNTGLQTSLSKRLDQFAQWWDKFASLEVAAVEGISGRETCESANHVAAALGAWHEAGTAAGDIAFWRKHAQQFRSPKAYASVVEALLGQRDLIAAMALLVEWLSRAVHISLVEGEYSFHELALRWMKDLWRPPQPSSEEPADLPVDPVGGSPDASHRWAVAARQRWPLTQRFLDYLEANAEEYWHVPRFELAAGTPEDAEEANAEQNDPENLFSAAYEGVTYRDSTDDGFEGEMLEGGAEATDFELLTEAERIVTRLSLLSTVSQLWKLAATASIPEGGDNQRDDRPSAGQATCPTDGMAGWLDQATTNYRALLGLLAAVHRYRIPAPRGTLESLIEYDHRRGIKEMLTEQIIATCVETADAARMIRAVIGRCPTDGKADDLGDWERPAGEVLRAVLRGRPSAGHGSCPTDRKDAVRESWGELTAALLSQPLLYVALARGGNPQRIVASRGIQCVLRRLLTYLPRLGMLPETCSLIETVQDMELEHPVGPGAITEFDQLFEIACKAIARCLVVSSEGWQGAKPSAPARRRDTPRAPPLGSRADLDLIGYLENATEALLRCWLVHSRGVRLSVLETVQDERRWRKLKRFIEHYGSDLFTQRFMNMGNLRAILHQGVDAYLRSLEEEPDREEELRLLGDLGTAVPREEAVRHLSTILEAVVENYPEYIDYNSITTQSDHGEMLYTLLDFLRLRTAYDRVAWNLRPVVLVHEVLVRLGRDEAAEIWREAVVGRTGVIAEEHLRRLAELSSKYGMRLPSIADRLGERFVRPLAIDRLRALVRPAIEELRGGRARPSVGHRTCPADGKAFARLEEEIAQFTQDLSGAGFDVPGWLQALGQEVEQVQSQAEEGEQLPDPHLRIPQVRLSKKEVRRQVKRIMSEE